MAAASVIICCRTQLRIPNTPRSYVFLFNRLSPKIGHSLALYFHVGFILSFMQTMKYHFVLDGPIRRTIPQHPRFRVKRCKLHVVPLLEAKEERISTFTLENDIDPANSGENDTVFHQL